MRLIRQLLSSGALLADRNRCQAASTGFTGCHLSVRASVHEKMPSHAPAQLASHLAPVCARSRTWKP
jgi:hypothetical protein